MPSYFVDAWFLIALFDRRDGHHHAARAIDRRLRGAEFVTHDAVLTELLAYTSGGGAATRRAAVESAREFMRRARVRPVGRDLFLAALNLYHARPDKEYSLVDCMSMLVMRAEGITHVLTNDHHFRQEGFTVVSE